MCRKLIRQRPVRVAKRNQPVWKTMDKILPNTYMSPYICVEEEKMALGSRRLSGFTAEGGGYMAYRDKKRCYGHRGTYHRRYFIPKGARYCIGTCPQKGVKGAVRAEFLVRGEELDAFDIHKARIERIHYALDHPDYDEDADIIAEILLEIETLNAEVDYLMSETRRGLGDEVDWKTRMHTDHLKLRAGDLADFIKELAWEIQHAEKEVKTIG